MADNTDEEHLDNPTDKQSENPPDEIIPPTDTETIKSIQETENMEVHHHAHHGGKKNWKSYFWEFLMLFLAVFCGFLAEYQLEHKIERDREKQYIHSMINDLKTDTAKLSEINAIYQYIILRQDTLLMTFSSLNNGFNEKFYSNLLGGVSGYPDFIYTDATIQQLKNSGGFRILRNRKDIDSILLYDEIVKKALINEAVLNRINSRMNDLTYETFDFQSLFEQTQRTKSLEKLETEKYDLLLSHDKKTLSKYYNHLWFYRNWCKGLMMVMKDVKIGATRLISYLEREYDLQ